VGRIAANRALGHYVAVILQDCLLSLAEGVQISANLSDYRIYESR
jgi:hypothetical protein